MAFDIHPKKQEVDPQDLERFARGAETHTATLAPIANAEQDRITESMLFRCSKHTLDEIAFVFEHTNVKSKQKLLESILLPEIKRMAEAIRAKQ